MPIKPRLFIGSSSEAIEIARSIQAVLASEVECSVWDASFKIGTTNIDSLLENLATNDFGVFVFAPDDAIKIRDQWVLAARDNVLYELGLFSGRLGPHRCFFALPDAEREKVRIPSDLAGVAHGTYESRRSDGNMREAVSSFCSLVRSQITLMEPAPPLLSNDILELAVQFECAEWIQDNEQRRVEKKREIVQKMIDALRRKPEPKLSLLKRETPGFLVLFSAAVQANPQIRDDKLILSIPPERIPRGVAQWAIVDYIRALRDTGKIDRLNLQALSEWLGQLHNVDDSLKLKLTELRTKLN